MQPREWALVAFTLLMQSSIGTLLIVIALSPGAGSDPHLSSQPFAVAACVGALALLASLLHLGHPAQAWLALTNIRTSWLSREIVASMLFVVSAAMLTLQRRGSGDTSALSAAAVVLGLIVIYAMSRLYMLPAQPAWNRLVTPLTFFASALLLGTMFVITTSVLDPMLARRLAFVAMGLLVVQSVLTPVYVAGLPGEPAAAISVASLGSTAIWLTVARVGAAIVAVLLLQLLLATAGASTSIPLGVITFAFVLMSELVGRVLFYAGGASMRPVPANARLHFRRTRRAKHLARYFFDEPPRAT